MIRRIAGINREGRIEVAPESVEFRSLSHRSGPAKPNGVSSNIAGVTGFVALFSGANVVPRRLPVTAVQNRAVGKLIIRRRIDIQDHHPESAIIAVDRNAV